MDALVEYYSQRAPEYEEIYTRSDPVRQKELATLQQQLKDTIQAKHVLELACGTGFWTQAVARHVLTLTAVDASAQMLEFARAKLKDAPNVTIFPGDAYDLNAIAGEFDTGFAMFWLSHVPRKRLSAFIGSFSRRIGSGGTIFMADNVNVPGLGGELVRDSGEDTFKVRKLKDGSEHRVIKNYFSAAELKDLIAPHGRAIEATLGTAYWWVCYQVL